MPRKTDAESFTAILDGEVCEVPYRQGQALLESMLADGLDPPFQCMDGNCGSCMVLLLQGDVDMRKNNVLSQRDLDRGYVLLCQSIPLGENVRVDCDA